MWSEIPPEEVSALFSGAGGPSGLPFRKVKIYNLGVCDLTTSELLELLDNWLEKFMPDTVVLLVGAANRFNTLEYKAHNSEGFRYVLLNKLSKIRVVRMVGMLYFWLATSRNVATGPDPFLDFGKVTYEPILKNSRWARHAEYLRRREGPSPSGAGDAVQTLWELYRTGRTVEAINAAEEALVGAAADARGNTDLTLALAHFYYEAEEMPKLETLLVDVLGTAVDAEPFRDALSYYLREHADRKRRKFRFDDAAEYYLKAIRYEPEEHYNYYWVMKCCDLQSRFTSEMFFKALDPIINKHPMLHKDNKFRGYLNYFREKMRWEAKVTDWTQRELEEAILLCRGRGINVILQNYPISYPMANGVLEGLAKKFSLPLVDNLSVFSHLEPKEAYLFNDSHCTAEGHRIMAENVYRVLTGEQERLARKGL